MPEPSPAAPPPADAAARRWLRGAWAALLLFAVACGLFLLLGNP